MKNELPKRKKNRLTDYDYSEAGYYFVTICVRGMRKILGSIVGANCVRPCLSAYGNIIENEISNIENSYENVKIIKHIIMPNHIHMIITIDSEDSGRTQFAPTLSRIIKQFKGSVTKQIGFSIWQKSFHDHIIRNEKDYLRIWQYIEENPLKWEEDCYFAEKLYKI